MVVTYIYIYVYISQAKAQGTDVKTAEADDDSDDDDDYDFFSDFKQNDSAGTETEAEDTFGDESESSMSEAHEEYHCLHCEKRLGTYIGLSEVYQRVITGLSGLLLINLQVKHSHIYIIIIIIRITIIITL